MRLLCETQTRLMVAEQSAMLARMAATLTHELNTPVGALLGSAQTLRALLQRMRHGEIPEPAKIEELEAALATSMKAASERIHHVIGRIQRFSNLYGAHQSRVDLVNLIEDVAAMVDPELRLQRSIRLQLDPHLAVDCHPEQLAAVFSSLLHRLLRQSSDASVTVTASLKLPWVRITVAAPLLHLPAEQLHCLTHPGLQSSQCTWNLYSTRQILLAHGGDVKVETSAEAGTIFMLTLPAAGPPESAGPDGQDRS